MLDRLTDPVGLVAQVDYTAADFKVRVPGRHVLCAITGKAIPLDELKYWSWERQEAYVDVESSVEAERRAGRLT
ncbi:MAG: DUF2093 domain-containing protein [Pseudomonadota bacterium]